MRINHNIAALNTYNKLSANQATTAKSLEKLSSGLKINKAGDNAAGLAISEKMRGQIRGLDQASTNANDAISLINTAEGALGETHSILQRMRELAVQSSNDSNVTIDRDEIQKEMNQLTSEINRIGNTTEFNTQKLLNGGGTEKALTVNTITAGAGVGEITNGNAMATVDQAATWTNALAALSGGNVEGNSGSVSFNGTTITLVTDSGGGASGVVGTATATAVTISMGSGVKTADELSSLLMTGFNAMKAATGSVLNEFTFTAPAGTGLVATGPESLRYNDATLTITSGTLGASASFATTVEVDGSAIGEASFDVTELKSSKLGVAEVINDTITMGTSGAGPQTYTFKGVSVSVTFASGAVTSTQSTSSTSASITFDSLASASGLSSALANAFNAIKTEGADTSLIKDFVFSATGSAAELTMTAQTKGDQYTDDKLTVTVGGATTDVAAAGTGNVAGIDEVRGEYAFTIGTAFEAVGTSISVLGQTFDAVAKDATGNQFNVGTDEAEQAASLVKAMNSNTTISARFDVTSDGSKITLTEKAQKATGTAVTTGIVAENVAVTGKAQFNVDELVAVGGKFEVDGVKIEVTDDATHSGLANGTAVLYSSTLTGQAQNLAGAINANSTLNAKYIPATSSSNTITLEQKTGKTSLTATDVKTGTNANDGFKANFQIGANTAQSLTVEVNDMRSVALNIAGQEEAAKVTAKNGSVASYTATKNITDGTTNTGVEYALDVSTHEKATAAISVINDAIESVSAERSKLGSYQNRLEHTINNLGTSSENLTTAESRIRDVDMAKEMMEFTKNNILSQAAQSMLAQANQQPQGVLQLLQ